MSSSDKLKISLQEILSATNRFAEANIIGIGGYGRVYRGESRQHGDLAVKRLILSPHGQGEHEYGMEVSLLSKYKHENLVSLIGFCGDNGEKILVYKYEPNGSLDKALRRKDLSWMRRLEICVGAATGLRYLHNETGSGHGVIHRDIKSSNILLDENWNAKISDFGLSKIALTNSADSVVFTIPCGTRGYVDPQILNGGITQKSDVYSFGVVLYEVLFGKLVANPEFVSDSCFTINIAKKRYKEKTLHMMIDPDLRNEMDSKSLSTFSTIAYQCLKERTDDRPTMSLVVEALEKALYYEQRSKLPSAMQGSMWADFQINEEPQSEFDALEIETLFRATTIPKKDTTEGGRRNSKLGKVYLVDWRRANSTESMLMNIKMPLPNMIVSVDYNILEHLQCILREDV
ncbi:putative protein kinase RLK-Pelle-CrRLK1L-1 family [Helianthus debilis subsp. tardiflorus]